MKKLGWTLAACALLAGAAAARGDDHDLAACTGTYLIEEGGGAVDLWTFHRDGTLVNTSQGEQLFNFSTQHGSWKQVGSRSSRAIQLDLHRADDGSLASIGRVDIELHGVGHSCDQIAGDLSGRLFEAGSDPLAPNPDTPALFQDTFSGRRVQ